MGHARPGTWTQERIALFETIHDQRPKAIWLAVNALPGPQLTKSAVIGRRDRHHGMVRRPKRTMEEVTAGLLARRERENEQRRVKRAANRGARIVNFNRREAAMERAANGGDPGPYACAETVDVVPRHLSLADLEARDCRYPYGDGPFTFCGHRTVSGKPYCPSHCRISYQAPKPLTRPGFIELGKSSGGIFRRTG